MSQADQVADSVRGVVSRHRGVKAPDGAKRGPGKQVRLQLHLGEQTVKRLAVHAALSSRNQSKEAERILRAWLIKSGKGREMFPSDPSADDSDPSD